MTSTESIATHSQEYDDENVTLVLPSGHPAASPELFAAFAALWALTQDEMVAGTGAPMPQTVGPMALHAGADLDPLGDAHDVTDAKVLLGMDSQIPLAVSLIGCGIDRLALRGAALIHCILKAEVFLATPTNSSGTMISCFLRRVSLALDAGYVAAAVAVLHQSVTAAERPATTRLDVELLLGLATAGGSDGRATCAAMGPLPVAAVVARFLRSDASFASPRADERAAAESLRLVCHMARASVEQRAVLVRTPAIAVHLAALFDHPSASVIVKQHIAVAIGSIFAHEPPEDLHLLAPLVPVCARAALHDDVMIALNAVSGFRRLLERNTGGVAAAHIFLATSGSLASCFVAMRRHNHLKLTSEVLRILECLCNGPPAHIAVVAAEPGLMRDAMPFLLRCRGGGYCVAAGAALEVLHVLLATESSAMTTMMSAFACAEHGTPPVFAILLQLMQFDRNPVVRSEAAHCVAPAAAGASDADVQRMLAAGVIPAVVATLAGAHRPRYLMVRLDVMARLMDRDEADVGAALVGASAHVATYLEALRHHPDRQVASRAEGIFRRLPPPPAAADEDAEVSILTPPPPARRGHFPEAASLENPPPPPPLDRDEEEEYSEVVRPRRRTGGGQLQRRPLRRVV